MSEFKDDNATEVMQEDAEMIEETTEYNSEMSSEDVINGMEETKPNKSEYNYAIYASEIDSEAPIYTGEEENDKESQGDGLCVAALVLGIVGFIVSMCYICPLLAIIFGIIGHVKKGQKSKIGMIGWILGALALTGKLLINTILAPFTGGLSFLC